MARQDPSLFQLCREFENPARKTAFLCHFDLLPNNDAIGQDRNGDGFLAFCSQKPFNPNKPFCPRKIKEGMRNGNPVFRCTRCRSEKTAHHGPSAYDALAAPAELPVFNHLDVAGRPSRKIDPQDVVYVAFCLVKDIRVSTLPDIMGRKLGDKSVVHWSQTIRKIMLAELETSPKMGGVGEVVEVDECFMKGRRKANQGRYLQGNHHGHHGHRVNNYLRRSQGPWLFGMICRSAREVRSFWVKDRTAATLIPLIKNNVAPGTMIFSDEWRAYSQVVNHGYGHQAVNHSRNFVDPVTGCSTQMIERQWREIKKLLRLGPGVRERTLPSHLALHWWKSLNGRRVCSDSFYRLLELVAKHSNQLRCCCALILPKCYTVDTTPSVEKKEKKPNSRV